MTEGLVDQCFKVPAVAKTAVSSDLFGLSKIGRDKWSCIQVAQGFVVKYVSTRLYVLVSAACCAEARDRPTLLSRISFLDRKRISFLLHVERCFLDARSIF